MADIFEISGRIHSTSQEEVVTTSSEILDEGQNNKKQSEINADVQSELNAHDEAINAPSTGLEARVETLEEQVAFSGDFQTANTPADVVSGSGKITTANAVAAISEQLKAEVGYYPCTTAAGTAAKVIPASDAPNYVLTVGGSIKVKMTNKNTAANPTLKIGNAEAKPLYYGASRASSSNTWEAGEVIEVYYDGENFMANNVEGGGGDGVFDISAYNASGEPIAPAVYNDLAAAIGTDGANIPANIRRGGMSIKFIQGTEQSSDNKYVQYRLMHTLANASTAAADFANTANWQGIDETPTAGSQNLITSGGVDKTKTLLENINNDLFTLKNGNLSTTDGTEIAGSLYNHTSMLPATSVSYLCFLSQGTFQQAFYYSKPNYNAESFVGTSLLTGDIPIGAKYVSFLFKNLNGAEVSIIDKEKINDILSDGFFRLNLKSAFSSLSDFNTAFDLYKYRVIYCRLYGNNVDRSIPYLLRFTSWDGTALRVIISIYSDNSYVNVIDDSVSAENNQIDTTISQDGYNLDLKMDLSNINNFTFGTNSNSAILNERAFYPESSEVEMNTRISTLESEVTEIDAAVTTLDNEFDSIAEESIIKSANLFNKDAVEVGSLKTTDGSINSSSTNYRTSDFIEISNDSNYRTSGSFRYACFYKEDRTFIENTAITSSKNSILTTDIPDATKFVRISISLTSFSLDDYMLVKGNSVPSEYIPYKEEVIYKIKPEALPDTPSVTPPEILLPEMIDTFVGDNLQLFWRSIINDNDLDKYYIVANVAGIKGKDCLPRYLSVSPKASEIGNHTLSVYLYDSGGKVVNQKDVTLRVNAAPTSPATNKNIMFVGASVVAKGYIALELNRRLTLDTGDNTPFFPTGLNLSHISFVGRKTGQYANIHQEATGGRTWLDYTSAPSKACRFNCESVADVERGMVFINNGIEFTITEINQTENTLLGSYSSSSEPEQSGTLTLKTDSSFTITYQSRELETTNPFAWDSVNERNNFINYCSENNISGIDYIVPFLGVNDLYSARSIESIKASILSFIDWFHDQNTGFPNAKVILSELYLPSYFGGYGNANTVSNFANRRKQVQAFNKMVYEIADDSNYSSFVVVAPICSQFDCEYGYTMREFNKNNRVNNYKDILAIDEIHPSAPYLSVTNPSYDSTINSRPNGYYMMSDTFMRVLANILSN